MLGVQSPQGLGFEGSDFGRQYAVCEEGRKEGRPGPHYYNLLYSMHICIVDADLFDILVRMASKTVAINDRSSLLKLSFRTGLRAGFAFNRPSLTGQDTTGHDKVT